MVTNPVSYDEVMNGIAIYITTAFTSALATMGFIVNRGVTLSHTLSDLILTAASMSVAVAVLAFAIWRYPYQF